MGWLLRLLRLLCEEKGERKLITVTDNDKNLIVLIIIMVLWTILSIQSFVFIGLIGLAIGYRRIVKLLDSKKEIEK